MLQNRAGVTFGAMHGVLPVALLTMNAIRNVPPVYLKSARTPHLSKGKTILTVLLPATLPEVVSGLRIGFTLTLLGVLLAEMFAAKHGLGFLIINAMQLLQAEEMVTVAVVLFVFASPLTRCCLQLSTDCIAGFDIVNRLAINSCARDLKIREGSLACGLK